jgi:5-histidylcysteine sulfoxide synthase/putative 4-mercaptohistidine N1-methyltranferase
MTIVIRYNPTRLADRTNVCVKTMHPGVNLPQDEVTPGKYRRHNEAIIAISLESAKAEGLNVNTFYTMPVTLTGSDPEQKREEIRAYFHKSFDLFERLFDVFADDSVFYLQSEPTRHPMIFYFGHTATFFVNKLILSKVITERINPEYESLFAIGVDEMHWDDLDETNYRWPDVEEVRAYRDDVRILVDELITTLPLTLPITQEDPFWIILMGIEHERIHIETSSVLHRQLPIEKVRPIGSFPLCSQSGKAPENVLVDIAGDTVRLGKQKEHHLYGWDNEYGESTVTVEPFLAAKYLVSNGEFMEFVLAGGYETPEYWDEEGQTFLTIRQAACPVFWVKEADSYRYRAMTQVIDMPMDWPVDVNYLEASAFCRWKSERDGKPYRLPTEAEWTVMANEAKIADVPEFDDTHANINLRHFASACPVNRFSTGRLFDVVGNVWQWTETSIDAFEGFEPHPAYDDFSTPTFDGKHNLIKGGSWISTGNEIMRHSRYAFRRHFYQHAGFRYLQAEPLETVEANIYESDALVSQYCEFQYGESHFGVPNFSTATAERAVHYAKEAGISFGHALDLGCATGRTSFELAASFERVTGIDFSARFIQVGVELQTKGSIGYHRAEEGALTSYQERSLEAIGLDAFKNRVDFWQGDACNLKPNFSGYDLLLATNLIDRLYEPKLFLESVHDRLNAGGLLILTSPYTWQEESTKQEFWLGGYVDDAGNPVHTLEALTLLLAPHFELMGTEDIPFVIRETPRKFQHTLSQMSVWRKKR